MLFYTSIFIACIAAGFVLPWLYRLISRVGSAIFRIIFPRSDNGPTSHLQLSPVPVLNHETKASLAGSNTRQDAGGDNSYFGPRNNYSVPLRAKVNLNSAGWIRREDKETIGGRTYKVNRRLKVREKNPRYVSKPVSWS